MTQPPRCLIVAPYTNKEDVGESRSNARWVEGLANSVDVTLLTCRLHGTPPISEQFPHIRIIEWEDSAWTKRVSRLNAMLKPSYIPFYFRAKRWIANALRSGEKFDIAHQLSPLAMRYPTPLRCFNIPYIMGPLGGSLAAPEAFKAELNDSWYIRLRRFDRLRFRFDPWLRKSYQQASLLLTVAPYVSELIGQSVTHDRFEFMSETGVDRLPPESPGRGTAGGPVRLLYVGRLIRTKGLYYAIQAISKLASREIQLDIAGRGVDEQPCRELVQRLGLSDLVTFHGQLAYQDVMALYKAADVFVFPSIREPSGNVVLEALSNGLPVVTTRLGGPGYVVDDRTGYRCRAEDPDSLVSELAQIMGELHSARSKREEMGRNAREVISEKFLWNSKVDWMLDRYCEIIRRHETENSAQATD